MAVRVGSALQTEGPLWWPAATGDSVDPADMGNVSGAVPAGWQRRGGRAGPSAGHVRKNTEGEGVKKAADVGVGKEIREEEGGGEAKEESPDQAKVLVLVFVFIRVCVY